MIAEEQAAFIAAGLVALRPLLAVSAPVVVDGVVVLTVGGGAEVVGKLRISRERWWWTPSPSCRPGIGEGVAGTVGALWSGQTKPRLTHAPLLYVSGAELRPKIGDVKLDQKGRVWRVVRLHVEELTVAKHGDLTRYGMQEGAESGAQIYVTLCLDELEDGG